MSPAHRGREEYRFDARYGRLIRKAGIGTIPFALFYYQAEMELSPQEVWLIGYVLSHRWTAELPYPAVRELARRSGVSTKTIEKYKKGLEEKGYLVVVRRTRADGGNTSIGWDFSPLFEQIDDLITRDIEQWVRRNPQFLEEELPGLGGDSVDYPGDKSTPVVRGYHTPVEGGVRGARRRGVNGAGAEGSHAPWTTGNTHVEEETIEEENEEALTNEAVKDHTKQNRSAAHSASKTTSRASNFVNENAESAPVSPLIDRIVHDYSARLHDAPKSVRSNCTRARRLWHDSWLGEEAFVALLHQAYERTEENSHRIRKWAKDGPYGTKNKMPYFFSVLVALVEEGSKEE
ncbi:MAG: helix-turn-helix domain-containing protein [Chloroflexota bacterium]